jgi:hypothetical protein
MRPTSTWLQPWGGRLGIAGVLLSPVSATSFCYPCACDAPTATRPAAAAAAVAASRYLPDSTVVLQESRSAPLRGPRPRPSLYSWRNELLQTLLLGRVSPGSLQPRSSSLSLRRHGQQRHPATRPQERLPGLHRPRHDQFALPHLQWPGRAGRPSSDRVQAALSTARVS